MLVSGLPPHRGEGSERGGGPIRLPLETSDHGAAGVELTGSLSRILPTEAPLQGAIAVSSSFLAARIQLWLMGGGRQGAVSSSELALEFSARAPARNSGSGDPSSGTGRMLLSSGHMESRNVSTSLIWWSRDTLSLRSDTSRESR